MKDHGYDSRQKLIASTFDLTQKSGRRDAYRFWISRGHSETASSNASGYHPIEEFDNFIGRFTLIMVALVVGILLFILANSVQAANDLEGSSVSEEAFIRCLNGESVKFSDGSRWMCMKLMGEWK